MQQTRLVQLQLSSRVSDFVGRLGLSQMTNAHTIVFQAEGVKTVRDKRGSHYADGRTPFQWALDNGIRPLGYFIFTKPHDEQWYQPTTDPLSDMYWLRKSFLLELRRHPAWTRPSPWPGKPFTNMADPGFQDFLVELLLGSGCTDWYFDEMHVNNHHRVPVEQVAGMFRICDRLRAEGHTIMANAGWHMEDPHEKNWHYDGMDHFDGVQTEFAVDGVHDGLPDPHTGHWWTLDPTSMERVQADWTDAGKEFWMLTRYIHAHAPHDNYHHFAMGHIELSKSFYAPHNENYQATNWLDDFRPWLLEDTAPAPEPVVVLADQDLPIRVLVDGKIQSLPGTLTGV